MGADKRSVSQRTDRHGNLDDYLHLLHSLECSGQVTSDQGWTAPLKLVGGSIWVVAHDVPNWEQCGDGMPAATGRQIFRFATSDNLRGDDKTTGPSGACGVNKWLTIDMPFKLEKID